MKQLKDKVAVITGAASGFGRELALLCAREGMKLVLADVDEAGLLGTEERLQVSASRVLRVHCDVSDAGSVEALAAQTYDRFGAAHLLFNNAGVSVVGPLWSATLEDWKWVLDVNLMGVVHGVRSFVPRLLLQGGEAHVVNTASVAGLLAVPGSAVYCVSKHGVVVLSECLHHELQLARSGIRVSVLCPAFVNTGIAEASRNRPPELAATNPAAHEYEERAVKAVRSGRLSAADVARITLDGVKKDRFYILTHPAIKPSVEGRLREIVGEGVPTNPMP